MMVLDSSPAERRRFPRTQVSMSVQAIVLDPDSGDMVEHLDMVDISRGGIGATCSRPLYPGSRVLLRMPAPGLGVRRLCATIRRCQKTDNGYLLGIEFEHPMVSLAAEEPSLMTVAA